MPFNFRFHALGCGLRRRASILLAGGVLEVGEGSGPFH